MILTIPLPPSANKSWRPARTARGAKMVKRDAFAEWLAAASAIIRVQRAAECIEGPFAAVIELPTIRGDIDNRIKPTLDACQHGGAIANDKHCRSLRVEIDDSRSPGTVRVELIPIPPSAPAPRRNKGNARGNPNP